MKKLRIPGHLKTGHDQSPLMKKKSAELVLGMEIHEAMRELVAVGKEEVTSVFPDVSWQPLPV